MLNFIKKSIEKYEIEREIKRLRKLIDSSDTMDWKERIELMKETIPKISELEVKLERM